MSAQAMYGGGNEPPPEWFKQIGMFGLACILLMVLSMVLDLALTIWLLG